MSAPVRCIPVGVVVERRKAISQWAEFLWRPVAVLAGLPDAAAWTPLAEDGDTVTYYAGPAEIALYRSEAENYRRNLVSGGAGDLGDDGRYRRRTTLWDRRRDR